MSVLHSHWVFTHLLYSLISSIAVFRSFSSSLAFSLSLSGISLFQALFHTLSRSQVGANYASIRAGKTCLTAAQITTLFNGDVANAKVLHVVTTEHSHTALASLHMDMDFKKMVFFTYQNLLEF